MTFGSLFAGIGGLDLGLERAGMECRWQVEIDEFCRKVLSKHWPEVPKYGDIRKLSGDELEPVELICGGYPCQPFSQAGKRRGTDDERHLWPEFARLVRILRPRYLLLENVPGHLSLGFGDVLGDLARLGFDAEWLCLRASDFGASHLRKRVFIVAYSSKGTGSILNESARDGRRDSIGNGVELAYARCSTDERCGIPGEASGAIISAEGEASEQQRGGNASRHVREDLAQSTPGGRGELREPSGRDGFIDGSNEDVAHAGCSGTGRPEEQTGEHREWASDDDRGASRALADPSNRLISEQGRGSERRDGAGSAGTFAPGPSDPRWPAILRERPDLAPAQSQIRRVADGVPDWLERAMSDRTKRLSRLGNAVVPQVAQWIGERIILKERQL